MESSLLLPEGSFVGAPPLKETLQLPDESVVLILPDTPTQELPQGLILSQERRRDPLFQGPSLFDDF